MARRPKPFAVGSTVRARAIRRRGPSGPADRRWYWRAEVWKGTGSVGQTVWTGWATRKETIAHLATLVVEQGETPKPAPPAPDPTDVSTVRDLLEVWCADVEDRAEVGDLSPKTATSYRQCACQLVGPLGPSPLGQLDRAKLDGFVRRRRREGSAPATIELALKVLRIAWRWGRSRSLVPPVDLSLPPVKVTPVRNRTTPTPADVAAVLTHLSGWPWLAVFLLASTGARIGEVAKLEWSAVDLERATVELKGKTGRRTVPLSPDCVAALLAHKAAQPEGTARVLSVAPNTVRASLTANHLPRACKAAQVPAFTPHGLRRAAVDGLLRSGVDVGTAAALLGHSPAVMLRSYRCATMADMRSAVESAGLGGRSPQPKTSFSGTPLPKTCTTKPAQLGTDPDQRGVLDDYMLYMMY